MDRLTAVLDPDVDQLQSLFESHVYNLSNHTVYYPIRHHSPACSYHLLRLIEEYKPDIILIEGPESGNPLISVLSDEATLPPVSLYYTYESELQREACYYPMLRYSPEYVALKEAKRLDIPVKFIDLDYQHFSTRASKSGQTEQKEISIQDETLLAGLISLTGCVKKQTVAVLMNCGKRCLRLVDWRNLLRHSCGMYSRIVLYPECVIPRNDYSLQVI